MYVHELSIHNFPAMVGHFLERRLSEINVGYTEHSILMYLNQCDTLNQGQIAKHFMLDKGAVAKITE